MEDSKYPEHDKLYEIKDDSQLLGTFLEWAANQGYFLAQRVQDEDSRHPHDCVTIKVPKTVHQLLAEFYDIDLQKLDEEKRDMLDRIRELNGSVKIEVDNDD